MNLIERGTMPPPAWVGRYQCARCRSVLELTDADGDAVRAWEDDQTQGLSVAVVCPVCGVVRWVSDCDHVIGRCGGRGFRDN